MKFVGVLMILASICLGLYVGGYLCFFMGIVTVIEQIVLAVNTGSLVASVLCWGIAKIVFANAIGWLSCIVLLIPGVALLNN